MDMLPTPRPFNPQFENVPLEVDDWNFVCLSLIPITNYSCKKFSPEPNQLELATVHLFQTYRQTDDRQTDNNHDNSSTVTKVRSAKNLALHIRDIQWISYTDMKYSNTTIKHIRIV